MKDRNGMEIVEGCYVRLLDVESFWFEYEPEKEAQKLREACKMPVKVSDIYEGKVTVDFPSTIDHDGEIVGNCITTTPDKLEVTKMPE